MVLVAEVFVVVKLEDVQVEDTVVELPLVEL